MNAGLGVEFEQENQSLDLNKAGVAVFGIHNVLQQEFVDDPAGV